MRASEMENSQVKRSEKYGPMERSIFYSKKDHRISHRGCDFIIHWMKLTRRVSEASAITDQEPPSYKNNLKHRTPYGSWRATSLNGPSERESELDISEDSN